jgi:hypothetical protein
MGVGSNFMHAYTMYMFLAPLILGKIGFSSTFCLLQEGKIHENKEEIKSLLLYCVKSWKSFIGLNTNVRLLTYERYL